MRDPAAAETLDVLVLTERSLGHDADALSHAEAAVDIVEELRGALSAPRIWRASFCDAARSFSPLIDLLTAGMPLIPRRVTTGRCSKSASAPMPVASARVECGPTKANAPPDLLAQWSALLHRVSAQAANGGRRAVRKAEALDPEIDELRAKIDKVEAEIGRAIRASPSWSAPRPVSPKEISDGLEPGTMLLEYSLV